MHYTQLGRTDLIVSRICFGCWQLSPAWWGEVPIEPWEKAVRGALDLGINFIDTADAYGDGYAESCLGELFERDGLRDRFILATKFFWNFEEKVRHPDTTYEYILRACEASLRRLKTDRIDLYQIHAWDPLTRPDEVAAALGQLKKEGKVRHVGVSNQNVEQMELYADRMDVECLQPPYSLLRRDVEARELPYCQRTGMGAIPYSPLYRGLLTGKYARDHEFADSRKDDPLFTGKKFQRILDGVDELRPIAEEFGLTVPQLAIRWVLTHPAVTAAIVGVKKPEHIETIVPAAEATFSVADWYKIAGILATAKKEAEAI